MKECIHCKKPITQDQDYLMNDKGDRIHVVCYYKPAAG